MQPLLRKRSLVHDMVQGVGFRPFGYGRAQQGFILEEGLPMAELGAIAPSMGCAAREAGVSVVTGDEKVVDTGSHAATGRGRADVGEDAGASVGQVGCHHRARHRSACGPGGCAHGAGYNTGGAYADWREVAEDLLTRRASKHRPTGQFPITPSQVLKKSGHE
jgi:hypothetical protein